MKIRIVVYTTLLFAIIGGIYINTYSDVYETSQAIIVRNDTSHVESGPGKFRYPEEMKNHQEVLVELARNMGAKIKPPKGAELGKTEICYLVGGSFDKLQRQFQNLRAAQARSMLTELRDAASIAKANLLDATTRLTKLEKKLGGDLAELRSMQEWTTGDSALRRTVEELRAKIADISCQEKIYQKLLLAIDSMQEATLSSRLLETHPPLKRLKEGLSEAHLRTATLLGTYTENHPKVIAAVESERIVHEKLKHELILAYGGIKLEGVMLSVTQKSLEQQLATVTARLQNLASLRAEYVNTIAEVKNYSSFLDQTQRNLFEAQTLVHNDSLILRVGEPVVSIKQPTRLVVFLTSILGGILTGIGLVCLIYPPDLTKYKPVV